MATPLESHCCAVKHIMCYLSGTVTRVLIHTHANHVQKFSLHAYNNFDSETLMTAGLPRVHVCILVPILCRGGQRNK